MRRPRSRRLEATVVHEPNRSLPAECCWPCNPTTVSSPKKTPTMRIPAPRANRRRQCRADHADRARSGASTRGRFPGKVPAFPTSHSGRVWLASRSPTLLSESRGREGPKRSGRNGATGGSRCRPRGIRRSISRAGQTPGRRPPRASCSASRADCQRRLTVRSETPRTAAASDVRVYAALLYFLRDRPSCSPTNADLGRRACRSVATVKRLEIDPARTVAIDAPHSASTAAIRADFPLMPPCPVRICFIPPQ